jgi:hypothetical protein
MSTNTFTRKDKQTGETTILSFDQAVDQFIRDNYDYAQAEDAGSVEEYLNDMSTVFETQSALSEGGELDAGYFIYTSND